QGHAAGGSVTPPSPGRHVRSRHCRHLLCNPGSALSSDSSSRRHPLLQRRALLKAGSLVPTLGAASLLAACGGGGSGGSLGFPPSLPPETTAPVDTKVSSFGLVVLPDTQFYSRYASAETGNQFDKRYGSTPFIAQTQWLADNAAALKIPF